MYIFHFLFIEIMRNFKTKGVILMYVAMLDFNDPNKHNKLDNLNNIVIILLFILIVFNIFLVALYG